MNPAIRNKLEEAGRKAHYTQRRADILLDFVKTAIADGTLAPGDRLPTEFELAEALGISRTPVREAMRVLETIGLLEIIPGSGTFVKAGVSNSFSELVLFQTHLARSSVETLAEVRRIFERACAELAAQRATPDDLAAMRRAIDELEALHADPQAPLDAVVDADLRFHRAVYSAAGNPLVTTLANFVLTMLRPWIVETQARAGPAESIALHRAELQAIIDSQQGHDDPHRIGVRSAADRNMEQWLDVLRPSPSAGASSAGDIPPSLVERET